MWYLHSLFFCYLVGALLVIAIVSQAKRNNTPLTDKQICFLGIVILILMSVPLLNIVYCIDYIYSLIFNPYELEDETDDLIDNTRRSII